MLIFGLLVYVVLPELLLVSLLCCRGEGTSPGSGSLGERWWCHPIWMMRLCWMDSGCSCLLSICAPDFPGVSWWERRLAPLWPRDSVWLNPFCSCPWLLWHLEEDEKHFRPWIEATSLELAVSRFVDAALPCLTPPIRPPCHPQ